jgi:hypothetical protein
VQVVVVVVVVVVCVEWRERWCQSLGELELVRRKRIRC